MFDPLKPQELDDEGNPAAAPPPTIPPADEPDEFEDEADEPLRFEPVDA